MVNNGDGSELDITELDDFDASSPGNVVQSISSGNSSPNVISSAGIKLMSNSKGPLPPGEVKFEEKRMASATSTKIRHGDNFSSEEATANASHSRRVQGPDGLSYQESGQANSMKARLEVDGVVGEKAATVKQVSCYLNSFNLFFKD